MILRGVQDLVRKEKRRKERVKAIQKFDEGMGVAATAVAATGILFVPRLRKETREDLKEKAVNTVQTIKDIVQQEAETVKDFATHIEQEVCKNYILRRSIKDVYGKTEGVK